MSDKEKLLKIINDCDGNISFETIVMIFISNHFNEFSASRLMSINENINKYLTAKINKLEQAKFVAKERAGYLKRYLKGEMYTSKEVAEKYVDIQLENVQAIIDACNNKEED